MSLRNKVVLVSNIRLKSRELYLVITNLSIYLKFVRSSLISTFFGSNYATSAKITLENDAIFFGHVLLRIQSLFICPYTEVSLQRSVE